MSGPAPRPGWYPDPEHPEIDRYWDGAQWTPATQRPARRSSTGAGFGAGFGGCLGVFVAGLVILFVLAYACTRSLHS